MTTRGIKPGDAVLVIEQSGGQRLVYNALVVGFTMDEQLKGMRGEPAIEALFVATYAEAVYRRDGKLPTLTASGMVHITHRDFLEGRAALGYEELPGPIPGMCRYCHCTEQRACPEGCSWMDTGRTVCSSEACQWKAGMGSFRKRIQRTAAVEQA